MDKGKQKFKSFAAFKQAARERVFKKNENDDANNNAKAINQRTVDGPSQLVWLSNTKTSREEPHIKVFKPNKVVEEEELPVSKKIPHKPSKVMRQLLFSSPYKAPCEANNVTNSARETSGEVIVKDTMSIVSDTETLSESVAIVHESESEVTVMEQHVKLNKVVEEEDLPGSKKIPQIPTKAMRQLPFSSAYKAPLEANNVSNSARETSGEVFVKDKMSIVCETETMSDSAAIVPESESEVAAMEQHGSGIETVEDDLPCTPAKQVFEKYLSDQNLDYDSARRKVRLLTDISPMSDIGVLSPSSTYISRPALKGQETYSTPLKSTNQECGCGTPIKPVNSEQKRILYDRLKVACSDIFENVISAVEGKVDSMQNSYSTIINSPRVASELQQPNKVMTILSESVQPVPSDSVEPVSSESTEPHCPGSVEPVSLGDNSNDRLEAIIGVQNCNISIPDTACPPSKDIQFYDGCIDYVVYVGKKGQTCWVKPFKTLFFFSPSQKPICFRFDLAASLGEIAFELTKRWEKTSNTAIMTFEGKVVNETSCVTEFLNGAAFLVFYNHIDPEYLYEGRHHSGLILKFIHFINSSLYRESVELSWMWEGIFQE